MVSHMTYIWEILVPSVVNNILLCVDLLRISVEMGVGILIQLVKKADGDCINKLDDDNYTIVGGKGEDDITFLEKD